MNTQRISTLGLSVLMAASSLDAATIEQVRQSHEDLVKKVQTAVIVCTVELSFSPLTAEDVERSKKLLQSHPEQIAPALKVKELNRSYRRESMQVWVRNGLGEWKTESKDMRDLDQLMSREGIPRGRRSSLDTSTIVIGGAGKRLTLFPATKSAVVDDIPQAHGQPSIWLAPIHFGLLPEWLFEKTSRSTIAECALNGAPAVCLTLESDEHKSIAELDPDRGYQFRRLRHYAADGRLSSEETANDYRVIDGIHFPFRFESTKYDPSGQVSRHELITVTEAKFNRELPNAEFQVELPPRTNVLGGAAVPRQMWLDERRVVRCQDLAALIEELRNARRAPTNPAP